MPLASGTQSETLGVCQTTSSSSSSVVAAPIPVEMELHCVLATTGSATSVSVPCDASVGAVKTAACTAFNVSPHTVSVTHNGERLDDSTLLCDTPVTHDDITLVAREFADMKCPFVYNAADVVFSIAFSPNGEHCVLGLGEHTIEIFNTVTGSLEALVECETTKYIERVTVSQCGTWVFAGTDSETFQIDICTGKVLRSVPEVRVSLGLRSAVLCNKGKVSVRNISDLSLIHTISLEHNILFDAIISPCDKYVVTSHFASPGSRRTVATVWDATGNCIATLPGGVRGGMVVSPCSRWLAVVQRGEGCRVTTIGGDAVHYIPGLYDAQSVYTPSGRLLLLSGNAVCLYSPEGDACVPVVPDCGNIVAVSPCGRYVAHGTAADPSLASIAFLPYGDE